MSEEQQLLLYTRSRGDRIAPPRTFVMADPGLGPGPSQWTTGVVDAVIVDLASCAEREGVTAALTAVRGVLTAARARLDAQLWLRVPPAARLASEGYREALTDFTDVVRQADGLILPKVRSAADVRAVLALLGPGTETVFMPVVEAGVPLPDIGRLAKHPGVVRLAATNRTSRRRNLSLVSQSHGFPPPVNAVTSDPMDLWELIHDAVVARHDGFGGQCVPSAELAVDVGVLYQDADLSLFRFDGHLWCVGQAAKAVSYSAGLW